MSLNKRAKRFFTSLTTLRLIFMAWLIINLFIFLMPVSFEQSIFKNSDKIYHIFFSLVTAFLLYFSFRKWKFTFLGSFLFPILYGLFIEILQNFLPHREFSFTDLLCDASGGAIFVVYIFLSKNFSKATLSF